MKTTNNVQKAAIKSAAIIISLVLLHVNVHAQGIWKSTSSHPQIDNITLAMVGNVHEVLSGMTGYWSSLNSLVNAEEKEEALELEGWMTSESFFSSVLFENESEEALVVENWMLNGASFGSEMYSTVESEQELKIDSWMLDENHFQADADISQYDEVVHVEPLKKQKKVFRTKNFVYREVEESALQFEAWMFNPSHFKAK